MGGKESILVIIKTTEIASSALGSSRGDAVQNYEGTATAMLVINKNVASMTDPAEQVEVVNAIVPGMNQYFKIRDYEQMMPITSLG